jgi:RimJ/RimL family protein N-acetyltransferase
MRSEQTASNLVLEVLRRDPLKNVVLLKLLNAAPGNSIVHQFVRGNDAATLLLVDHRVSRFDREAYPAARASVIISSDRPELTREVLTFAPRGQPLIFKLANEADRLVVAEEFSLERRTAYFSYTSTGIVVNDPRVKVRLSAAEAPLHLFAAQGHSARWLAPLMRSGRAFASVIEQDGKSLSACFAFEIDGGVWEIGGVYTRPEERGKRLAFRVVHSALGEVSRRGRIPRYQVAEENAASIRLAEALGMTRCLTLTHYFSECIECAEGPS